MEAIVLAGGFGTRLSHIVKDVPKPMAQVAGRPFLEYILEHLAKNYVDKVVLATGYKHECISEHFKSTYKGMRLEYSVETEPLGTGGAIKKALACCAEEYVLVINGDTFFPVDLSALCDHAVEKNADIVIAAKRLQKFDRYGSIVTDEEGKVVAFKEKEFSEEGIINGGIYVLKRERLPEVMNDKCSFERDVLESHLCELNIYAKTCEEYFIDIGIEQDYNIAQKYFQEKNENTRVYFNTSARTLNASRNIAAGLLAQIASLLFGFIFRTIFIKVLAVEYLGINGLFTDILTLFSLAELGVGSAIVFRMYRPIAVDDIDKVSALLDFYKKIYRVIALVILVLGATIMPFIKYLIHDTSEIPSDVNIYVIYALFLMQSLSSYLFVYKTSIFTADQKAYVVSAMSICNQIFSTVAKIVVLYLTLNYTFVLLSGIVVTLLINIAFSELSKRKYKFVFAKKNKLDKKTIHDIKGDVLATMCHKVGGVIVTNTDSILISAMIGLGILGIYSNYTLIINAINVFMGQLLSSFIASIANSKLKSDENDYYNTYKRAIYLDAVATCFTTIALFGLLNPFISVWLGGEFLLPQTTVLLLCLSYFLKNIRQINNSFTNACVLFRRDKWRPFTEAAINLVVSIVLAKFMGIDGIFIGTIVSNLCTVFWREPYLLFKYEFKKNVAIYFIIVALSLLFTAGCSALMWYIFTFIPTGIGWLILEFVIMAIVPTALMIILTCRMQEFKYYVSIAKALFRKISIKARRK